MQNGTNVPETPQPAAYQGNTQYQAPPAPRRRDLPYKVPFLAGFLSGIIPGLGHIYVGCFREGLTIQAVLAVMIVIVSSEIQGLLPVAIVGIVFTYFYGIIDAVRRAQFYNIALDNDGQAPPVQGLEMPGRRGSVAGGAILIVLGFVIFLNINFGFTMAWLENWWPLGLMGLGAWLIVKSRGDQRAKRNAPETYDRSGDITSNR